MIRNRTVWNKIIEWIIITEIKILNLNDFLEFLEKKTVHIKKKKSKSYEINSKFFKLAIDLHTYL